MSKQFIASCNKWLLADNNLSKLGVFVLLFATIGTIVLLTSQAASPNVAFEPEIGTITSPASIVDDSSASNSKAVLFSAPAPTGLTLLWSDEFNGTSLDTTKWSTVTGTLDYDQGCYTNDTDNLQISGGNLVIRTKKEANSCPSAYIKYPEPNGKTVARPYTTAYVRTSPTKYVVSPESVSSKILRIEFRAQQPGLKGLWAALWSRNQYGSKTIGAPDPYGELDVMEKWGDEANNMTFTNTSWLGGKSSDGKTGYITNRKCPIPTGDTSLLNNCVNVATSMIVYAIEIDTSKAKPEVRYYADGRLLTTHNQDTVRNDGTYPFNAADWSKSLKGQWDLRIMTQVVDVDYPYHAEPDASFSEAEFKIDYVRVYSVN